MPKISFYSLSPGSRGDRFLLACRLIERIRSEHLRVLVYCPSREEASHLDRLLWTYREESFLPHGIAGQVDQELTPVIISLDGRPEAETQVLLNLAPEVPAFLERFERVCDLVDLDPRLLDAGRDRFRRYKASGYELSHHKISI